VSFNGRVSAFVFMITKFAVLSVGPMWSGDGGGHEWLTAYNASPVI
jgi:hypothetical protein